MTLLSSNLKKYLSIIGLLTSTLVYAETIVVGTMGTYNPFSYQTAEGQLTGYDLDVLKEIQKREPTLQFEFIASPWETLFPGLDAGRFQVLANQIVANPDREKRYYLTDESYFTCVSQIIVQAGRKDIQSLHDLKGKKIGLTVGDSHTRAVEDWNAANGNILTLTYYESDIASVLQDLQLGRIDATVNDPIMAQDKAKNQNIAIEVVGAPITADPARFIVQKTAAGQLLKNKLDQALQQMREDGTLSQLSLQYFQKDYTTISRVHQSE